MSGLNGQWALITGASKGLGCEVALQFADAGIHLGPVRARRRGVCIGDLCARGPG